MVKFETIKKGLEASVALRDAAKEERQRWKSVLAQVPKSREKMAIILLGDPRVHMTDAEIITACNVGMAPEGDSTGKQALFAQGMSDAAALLGKPAPVNIPEAYPATSREFHLDPALFQSGEAMAKSLKPFMVTAL